MPGSLKGNIDVEVYVDIDRYFGCLKVGVMSVIEPVISVIEQVRSAMEPVMSGSFQTSWALM